uniref:Mp1p-like protein 3 n=1 Tax=Talaromyces marneffei TaxID=37727 RepID=B8K395_TALMA|nr:Mp1p-like protein 3 [Talaromyces marneffei]
MKFLPTLIIFGLSAQALGSSYVDYHATKDRRDIHIYELVISGIRDLLDQLNLDIHNYTGGDPSYLLADFERIMHTINQGIPIIRSQPSLDDNETGLFIHYVQIKFEDPIRWAIEALIKKRDSLVTAGFGSPILQSLQRLEVAFEDLRDTVSEQIVRERINFFNAVFNEVVILVLQRGITAFAGPIPTSTGASTASTTIAPPTFTGATSIN